MNRAKGGRKNRKHGRDKNHCLFYKNSHRRERNKARRLAKHLVLFVGDACAKAALDKCLLVVPKAI